MLKKCKPYNRTHTRCRLAAKMGALRKLITEENNGCNPFNVSLKVTCFSKLYITARMRGAGAVPKWGHSGGYLSKKTMDLVS